MQYTKNIKNPAVQIVDLAINVFQKSFNNFYAFFNLHNLRLILFPILSLAYKEIISVLGFYWIWQKQYPWWFFIIYSLIGSISSFLWGLWGDICVVEKEDKHKYKLIIFADVLILFIFTLLFFEVSKWIIILLCALVDNQSNVRSSLANKKLFCKTGRYHEKSLFLNKLCWTAIFLCWAFFDFVKHNQTLCILTVFFLCLLSFLIYPKKISNEKNKKFKINENINKTPSSKLKLIHVMLMAFASYEAVFFLLWSFSEGAHVPINFFALTGGACLIGNILSFFSGKDKELKIIKHMYFSIFVLSLVSFLVLFYFPFLQTVLIIYSVIAALSGIYLPYVFDEAMRMYGKHKRGEASGLVEIYSSAGDIFSTIIVKFLSSVGLVSAVASILALIGYFLTIVEERQNEKSLE